MNIDCSCIESKASSFLYNHPLGVQVLSLAGSSKVLFDSSMKNLHLLLILAVVAIYATVRVDCGLFDIPPPAECIASCRNTCASASNCTSHMCSCTARSLWRGPVKIALPCCSFDEQCCE